MLIVVTAKALRRLFDNQDRASWLLTKTV